MGVFVFSFAPEIEALLLLKKNETNFTASMEIPAKTKAAEIFLGLHTLTDLWLKLILG